MLAPRTRLVALVGPQRPRRLAALALLVVLGALLVGCEPRNPLDTGPELPDAVYSATRALGQDLGVDTGVVQLVSLARQDWPNPCLGLAQEGESCDATPTPGWRIAFSVYGDLHIYRSDLGGNVVRAERR